MISQYFTQRIVPLLPSTRQWQSDMNGPAMTRQALTESGDLKTALQKPVARVRRDCRVEGIVKADGDASFFPVGAVVAAQLYRIAQGAVHNAVEHGGTRKVEIDVAFDQGNLVLTVRDNGKGFDTSAISKGMGLRIMRYRAQSVGGSCEVQSNRTKARLSPAMCRRSLTVMTVLLQSAAVPAGMLCKTALCPGRPFFTTVVVNPAACHTA